ncbi:uncharacterized protein STAUR_5766 [Stigmatella aurantiaca DW4/3-1]|uniref:Uncharacterized protein n=1 Tax=Stigmatella aurantiaca (strain DW4/3-1) TaxID=378806 RepID=E3FVY8_STIAD|nr:uncharacterized protein STAUR_5766 [Stigmatella aurantiaca DW4/3-1]
MGALWALAVSTTGCSDACEEAERRIDGKYAECGIAVGEPEAVDCTEDVAEAKKQEADCIEKASCEDVRSGLYLTKC